MFRSFALLALLFLSCAARAEEVMSADVGGTAISFPIPEGYVRASQAAPILFEMVKSAIPPEARVVETLLATSDLGNAGLEQPYYVYGFATMTEAMTISQAQWEEGRPVLAKAIGGVDADAAAENVSRRATERMREATGAEVNLQVGEVGKARVYSQAGGVVRFTMKFAMKAELGEDKVEKLLDYASAMLVLNGKLVIIGVYTQSTPEDAQFERARALLEDMIQRADALNEGTVG